MSGRAKAGRGRGKGFGNLEALGLKPGDGLPPPILQPPPLYPPTQRKPLELSSTETDRYLLCVKQELRQLACQSPFFLKPENIKKNFIERYRDKYSDAEGTSMDRFLQCIPSWNVLPKELHLQRTKRKPMKRHLKSHPSALPRKKAKTSAADLSDSLEGGEEEEKRQKGGSADTERLLETKQQKGRSVDLERRLDQLEKEEQTGSEGEVTGGETEEEYDEEVEEEEGDYQQTYFDPGDEYAVDEDDALDDGPSY